MARKSSLGPFPKTLRWTEIVELSSGLPDSAKADEIIGRVRRAIQGLIDDHQALSATLFFAALPVVTRQDDPVSAFKRDFGITYKSSLRETLEALVPNDSAVRRAALDTFDRFTSSPGFAQTALSSDDWAPWRELDGSAFCELGRLFFACLTQEYLLYHLRSLAIFPGASLVQEHAWEMSKITQSFSARWFNKCAVGQIPETGSVRWYLGHCLGKIDMELERALSNHVEPPPSPSRRKKVEPPSLGLGL